MTESSDLLVTLSLHCSASTACGLTFFSTDLTCLCYISHQIPEFKPQKRRLRCRRKMLQESLQSHLSQTPIGISPYYFRAASVTNGTIRNMSPSKLHSKNTYILLGFTVSKANDRWERYIIQSGDMSADFMASAILAVEEPSIPDLEARTDDWR